MDVRCHRRTAAHRLRRRLLRRPHRRRRAGGRRADRQRRPGGADLRDAGRAHAGAGAARPAAPTRDAGYEPLLERMLRAGAGALPRARHPHRQQLRRRQPARRGAAHPRAGARSSGLRAPRIAVVERRRPVRPRASRRCCASALGAALDGPRRSSAPTPISAPSRSPQALRAGAQIVVVRPRRRPVAGGGPGAGPLRLGRGRLGPPGPRDHGRPPARMRRAGHAAATTPTPASRTCRPGIASATRSREIDADGHCTIGKPPAPAACVERAHGEGATALRGARPGGLPDARRRGRHLRMPRCEETGPDRVRLSGVRGHARTGTLKVNVCFEGGWLGRRRDLLRRRRAPRRARGWPPTCCASGCRASARCAST